MNNKKSISPVVATSLLIVVAVLAVVSLTSFITTYLADTQVEIESNSGLNQLSVERLEEDQVFIRNSGTESIEIDITVEDCTSSTTNVDSGTTEEVSISGCTLNTGSAYDVVVVSSLGVLTEKEIVRG